MIKRINRSILLFFATALLIVAITTLVVLLAQGYRYDTKSGTLQNIGILAVTAEPKGASIKIDGKLAGATDQSSFNLNPGEYDVEISKDGYSTWKKRVKIVKEKVTSIEASLFPQVPNLSTPLTFTGIRNSKLSPDQRKIVYTVKNGVKSGLWVLDLSEGIFQSREPKQIATDRIDIQFSDAQTEWSADSNQVLATLTDAVGTRNYLLDIATQNKEVTDITPTIAELKESWTKDIQTKQTNKLSKLKAKAKEVADKAKEVIFSPDETKFIALGETEAILYDIDPLFDPEHPEKEENSLVLPVAKKYFWLPNSRNILIIGENTISVFNRDGSDNTVIYSGTFDPEVVFPSPSGTKIVIAATFNPAVRSEPDLYTLDLK